MTVADLAIFGADVYTVDAARRWAGAVAVRDGRIAAVGTEADVRGLVGPRTELLHLPGRMIVPGFQDAHVHPAFAGRNLLHVNLDDVHSGEGYLERIATYAREHPDEEWIVGGGWAMYLFPGGLPRKEDLDRVVPDRPVFLMNRDVHGAWVNSRALELAGIARGTPDPWDGRIERDPATGEPTGALHEGAAYTFSARHVPAPGPDGWRRAILVAQRHLHGLGITGWQDAWVTPDLLRAYRSLDDAGELTARVVTALWWDRHRGEEQIDGFEEQRTWGTGGNVRATTVKIMTDGVVENRSGAMLEPYLERGGRPSGGSGAAYVDASALRSAVTRLDALGFRVHMHAIGDRAVRNALDAIEAARRTNGVRETRHQIAHLQVVHPDDVSRFGRLGAVANIQPLWACLDEQMVELTLPCLGEERAGWQYPFGDLLRAGAILAGGSDWGVSSADPLLEMEVAVRRISPEARDQQPFLVEQCLSLPDAIAAFTIGSAYANNDDRDAGSIEVGKRADLAVLDRNVFALDAGAALGDVRVELTIAAGRVVFESSSEPTGSEG